MARTSVARLGRPPRRRLSGDLREQRIVDEAARFFAEAGFGGTTRALARRLGVTQALLYRYFPSKERLIDRVYQTVFLDRWDPAWDALLADRVRPLRERLTRFYQAYAARSTRTSMRLFLRGNLDGVGLARRYSAPLTERILRPLAAALRDEAGLPSLDARPLTRGERELAMMLHASVVFMGIRRHVYGMPIDDPDALVALYVDAFLERATQVLGRLSRGRAPDSLAIPVVDSAVPPTRRPPRRR